jgi:hypothetical protein
MLLPPLRAEPTYSAGRHGQSALLREFERNRKKRRIVIRRERGKKGLSEKYFICHAERSEASRFRSFRATSMALKTPQRCFLDSPERGKKRRITRQRKMDQDRNNIPGCGA